MLDNGDSRLKAMILNNYEELDLLGDIFFK